MLTGEIVSVPEVETCARVRVNSAADESGLVSTHGPLESRSMRRRSEARS